MQSRKLFKLLSLILALTMLALLVGTAAAQEPTSEPTDEAAVADPTAEPTDEPTVEPTAEPTDEPTAEPTDEPTAEPTAEPTDEPTAEPTDEATVEPTAEPTDEATAEPTDEATAEPTDEATAEPTDEATAEPTATITATATITPGLVTEEAPISIAAVNPPPQKSYALIQNLTGSTANITAQFFTGVDGSSSTPNLVLQVNRTIAPNSAINISTDPAAMPEAASIPSPWKGSLVIQSDQAVAATVVNFGSPTAHSIYEGSDSTKIGNDILMPSIHWNPAGQESVIGIQNTQSSAIQVNLTYFSKSGSTLKGPTAFTIPGNTTLYRNARTDCTGCAGVEGSARVTAVNSGNKVAVAVVEYIGNTAYAYDGIPATKAGRQFLLPSVHRNPAGQFTFALVQNIGSSPTNVTVQYRNAAGTIVDTKTQSIPGKGSFNFCTAPGCPLLPANMPNEGSAKIISASADIVISVVETVTGFPSAYNGFKIDAAASSAKTKQLFPSVHRNPGGQFSFLLVSNPSETTNATCTMVFKSSSTGQTNTLSNRVVPKKGSYNFITVPGAVPADDPTNLGNEGSATLTCNIPVVAVEVEVVLGVPATYEAFGQ